MSAPDLSGVPLARLADEIRRRACTELIPLVDAEPIGCDLANAIRGLGFYAQVWLPSDAEGYAPKGEPLTDDELSDIFRAMSKYDDAAMEANRLLFDDLVHDAIKSRKEGGAL